MGRPLSDDLLPRRLLLVGFMGSGKSHVGRRLASLLEWRFLDMDREIERHEGLDVADIFRLRGEADFREAEEIVARRLLREDRAVVASGGGWPCVPGRLEGLDDSTLTIWLRVSPETAVARIQASRTTRPLLEVEDPSGRARGLLAAREPFYRKARWTVDTEGRRADTVARELHRRIRRALEGTGKSGLDPGTER